MLEDQEKYSVALQKNNEEFIAQQLKNKVRVTRFLKGVVNNNKRDFPSLEWIFPKIFQ